MVERSSRTDEPIHRADPTSPQLQDPIAPITHDAPNNSAVLLLDPGLIVLAIRAAACELNPSFLAVRLHGLIQKHTVIVRVEPEQRERHSLANLAQHLGQQHLLAYQQRRALRPAGRDVRQCQPLRSSWNTTSRTQCSLFSTCQWHRTAWANSLASS